MSLDAVSQRINLAEVIDETRLGSFQIGIFVLCGICLIVDGFDVQAMGYVAPAIIQEWKLSREMMGPVFSATFLGVLIGSFVFSMLADWWGRRPALISATFFFALMTLATAQAGSLNELRWIRLIAGIGLGGIMPNAVALCGEFSPRSSRVLVMMLVGNGFTLGAAVGGFIAAWLIPAYGWRSVFYMGGTIPLLIALAMLVWLPESLQFLCLKKQATEKMARIIRRLNPEKRYPAESEFFVPEQPQAGVPLFQLFEQGRAAGTTLLWLANFMNLLNLYFLSSWLPTVVSEAGYSKTTGVYVGATLQLGGTLGAVLLGWLVKRYGFVAVLAPCFALSSVNIAFIGWPGLPVVLLFAVVFIAGLGVMGGQVGINALSASIYPTELRSTGIGAGLGFGRLGAIVGPLIGGQLMAWHWTTQSLFLSAALPAAVSALIIIALRYAARW